MKFSVLGASGFVGRELSLALKNNGHTVLSPDRDETEVLTNKKSCHLGSVFYCIGMTANFRDQPIDTIEAHIGLLQRILEVCDFDQLTYLSSTRVYHGGSSTNEEAGLHVNPNDPSDFYNISKLMGESICLSSHKNTRVVRLSNIYGENSSASFLNEIITEVKKKGEVVFRSSPNSSKDYVSIRDVTKLLPKIACYGKSRIYNVASGINTSNIEIADTLSKLGYSFSFEENAPTWKFENINIGRIKDEFGFVPSRLLDELESLI